MGALMRHRSISSTFGNGRHNTFTDSRTNKGLLSGLMAWCVFPWATASSLDVKFWGMSYPSPANFQNFCILGSSCFGGSIGALATMSIRGCPWFQGFSCEGDNDRAGLLTGSRGRADGRTVMGMSIRLGGVLP